MSAYTPAVQGTGAKATVQRVGAFLASMVMPNIAAFIAWGLITATFIETGWIPNEKAATLVGPMISFLLPISSATPAAGSCTARAAPWSARSPPWASSSAPTCRCSSAP